MLKTIYNGNQDNNYLNQEKTWKIPGILFSKMCKDHVIRTMHIKTYIFW